MMSFPLILTCLAYIHCPGSYLCGNVPAVNTSTCVTVEEVCDGDIGCPGGDDETHCGRYIKAIWKCSPQRRS